MEAESKVSAPLEAKHAIGPDSEVVYSPISENFLSLIGLNTIILSSSLPCKGTSARHFRHKICIIFPPYTICENRNILGFTFVTKLSEKIKQEMNLNA
jgi:hypothetical protein